MSKIRTLVAEPRCHYCENFIPHGAVGFTLLVAVAGKEARHPFCNGLCLEGWLTQMREPIEQGCGKFDDEPTVLFSRRHFPPARFLQKAMDYIAQEFGIEHSDDWDWQHIEQAYWREDGPDAFIPCALEVAGSFPVTYVKRFF